MSRNAGNLSKIYHRSFTNAIASDDGKMKLRVCAYACKSITP